MSGSPAAAGAPPAVTGQDVGIALGLPFLTALAWTTSESAWWRIARVVAPAAGAVLSRRPAEIARRVREDAAAAEEIAHELVVCEIVKNFQTVREHLRIPWPVPWRPEIEVTGLEHLRAAEAAGKGAVLWDSHFYFASLMTKIGLYRVGVRCCHLSRPHHGFSDSRFGMRFLNPVRTTAESRYLGERVVMGRDSATAAMRTLMKRLKENAVVSVTVRATGLNPCAVPFLDGVYRIATGAPDLAFACGAPLLPVFTLRRPDGRYAVTIDPPIPLPAGRDRRAAAEAATAEYAHRLEPRVLAFPGQWTDWISI
jgi:lauroyl/myristoyl acyltransferase